jgi:hypothetical protein
MSLRVVALRSHVSSIYKWPLYCWHATAYVYHGSKPPPWNHHPASHICLTLLFLQTNIFFLDIEHKKKGISTSPRKVSLSLKRTKKVSDWVGIKPDNTLFQTCLGKFFNTWLENKSLCYLLYLHFLPRML